MTKNDALDLVDSYYNGCALNHPNQPDSVETPDTGAPMRDHAVEGWAIQPALCKRCGDLWHGVACTRCACATSCLNLVTPRTEDNIVRGEE